LAAAQGKTTLLIAHRLSTVVHAHEIVVLDQGQVVERGSHSALLAMQGVYARMWHLQQAAGEAE
jgi:ABC-type transport system involved in Fe-S cluster assembly fused permease/ATPase subunit